MKKNVRLLLIVLLIYIFIKNVHGIRYSKKCLNDVLKSGVFSSIFGYFV